MWGRWRVIMGMHSEALSMNCCAEHYWEVGVKSMT